MKQKVQKLPATDEIIFVIFYDNFFKIRSAWVMLQ